MDVFPEIVELIGKPSMKLRVISGSQEGFPTPAPHPSPTPTLCSRQDSGLCGRVIL